MHFQKIKYFAYLSIILTFWYSLGQYLSPPKRITPVSAPVFHLHRQTDSDMTSNQLLLSSPIPVLTGLNVNINTPMYTLSGSRTMEISHNLDNLFQFIFKICLQKYFCVPEENMDIPLFCTKVPCMLLCFGVIRPHPIHVRYFCARPSCLNFNYTIYPYK